MITPHSSSVHDLFPPALRDAFDRAFSVPARYPKSTEWVALVDSILNGKELSRCSRFPQNPSHIHFEKQDCIACKRIGLLARQTRKPPTKSWTPPPASTATNPIQPQKAKKDSGLTIAVSVIVGILVIAFLNNRAYSPPTPTVSASSESPADSTPSTSNANENTEQNSANSAKGFNLGAYRYLCNADTLEELNLKFSGTKGNYEVETPNLRYSIKDLRFFEDGTFSIKATFSNDPNYAIELAGKKTGADSFVLSRYIWRDGENKTVGIVLNGHVIKTDFRSVELINCTQ